MLATFRRVIGMRSIRYLYLYFAGVLLLMLAGAKYALEGWGVLQFVALPILLGTPAVAGMVIGWEMHKDPDIRMLLTSDEEWRASQK